MGGRIAVVGGGAAGIFASLAARAEGADVVLFEKNRRIGIKILISGGGKCNITHDAPSRELEKGFIPREGRFLRYALHELTPRMVLDALHAEGVETYTRPNGRVFPVSGRAEDVLAAFERMLDRAGVTIRSGAPVNGIRCEENVARGIVVDGGFEPFDAVVIATGGISYKKVGTTGDGIAWAGKLGHTIVPVRSALAPIYFPTPPPSDWQGVALRDVVLRVEADSGPLPFVRKEGYIVDWRGDLLFTHRGVSGPSALEVSRLAALLAEQHAKPWLVVDLLPDDDPGSVQGRWEDRLRESSRSEVQSFVEQFVPHALVGPVLDAAAITSGTKLSNVSRVERERLLATLKRWRIAEVGEVPIDRGEVTAGGIALGEIAPTTMMSRHVDGLYAAGEALDLAGSVGGYNLQAAFATGYIAGRSAARAAAATG